MVTQEEQNAIARAFADFELILCRDQYRLDRAQMLEIKGISFPYGPELAKAIEARKEWNLARKRVNELEKKG